jgi:hypothetical protein
MGVKGLFKYIKTHHANCIDIILFSECSGQKWAIDASGLIYKFCYNIANKKNQIRI